MAGKLKPTRPELKRQRDLLSRFNRYLPMLKLKQQQLQVSLGAAQKALAAAEERVEARRAAAAAHRPLLAEPTGVDVRSLARPAHVRSHTMNVAGVNVPVFDEAVFDAPAYSLFTTPPWVDRVLEELREVARAEAEVSILREQCSVLRRELTKVVQRVNLFEKVKIPEAKDAIRRIRIHLGDEMAAGVGRAKMAKARLAHEGEPGAPAEATP